MTYSANVPNPRASLDDRVLDFITEADQQTTVWSALAEDSQDESEIQTNSERETRFNDLACDLFDFQFAACPTYARFCRDQGVHPESLQHWSELPAVPTGAFKEVELRSFSKEHTLKTFCTSGTSTAQQGSLHLDTLELYEASLRANFRRHMLPGLQPSSATKTCFGILAPSPNEVPDSSLSHMFGVALQKFGSEESLFLISNDELQVDRFLQLIIALQQDSEEFSPLALCGTAFSWVHLLDELERRSIRVSLPPNTSIMETGGFKGRSRETTREELYARMETFFGISASQIVNQYGMTELGSQFYDSVLASPNQPRHKVIPPWVRVRILDPSTGKESLPGEPGVIQIYDLANTGSVLAVRTADLGYTLEDGFEVLGREAGAEQRGCSLAIETMLGNKT